MKFSKHPSKGISKDIFKRKKIYLPSLKKKKKKKKKIAIIYYQLYILAFKSLNEQNKTITSNLFLKQQQLKSNMWKH